MPTPENNLDEYGHRLATALRISVEQCRTLLNDLAVRYRSPDRHYHNLDHIRAVLDTVQTLADPAPAPALLVAVWFHDAVYDARAADNEERSAALARTLLTPFGIPDKLLSEAERLILLTKLHRCDQDDSDGLVLLDADLAILGANAVDYDRYAEAIRREYAWVPEEDYRKGRIAVLEKFLGRERIYHTDRMIQAAEECARRNLQREIAALASSAAASE